MIPTGATFGPAAFMAAWAGGLALTLPLAVRWRVAKRGYQMLGAGTAALLMIYPALRSWWAAAGLALVLIGIWRSDRPGYSSLIVPGAILGLVYAGLSSGWAATLAAAAALGGITSTMLLGHWFLVDPTLPRWAVRRLDLLAGAGLVLSLVAGWLNDAAPYQGGALAWALAGLAVISAALVASAWFALGETGYSGVMAATGLSYLGVVTVAGVVFLNHLMV
ncbi:MAG: hypothetical protein OXI06_09740 [bacterium]|nr:hypothetical protein [bacterium]